MPFALSIDMANRDEHTEANMKTFFAMLEELWVAAAFAEAGEYESLRITGPRSRESACLLAA